MCKICVSLYILLQICSIFAANRHCDHVCHWTEGLVTNAISQIDLDHPVQSVFTVLNKGINGALIIVIYKRSVDLKSSCKIDDIHPFVVAVEFDDSSSQSVHYVYTLLGDEAMRNTSWWRNSYT